MKARKLGSAHELPEELPGGEHVLWQGAPGWWPLTRSLHLRIVAGYFAVVLVWYVLDRMVHQPDGLLFGFLRFAALAGMAMLLFGAYAFLITRTSSYTFTNRRLIVQGGIALPISFNIPYTRVAAADVRRNKDGSGDIVMTLLPGEKVGYVLLWPHVRSAKPAGASPMLRAVPEVDRVARTLGRLLADSAGEAAGRTGVADTVAASGAGLPQAVAA